MTAAQPHITPTIREEAWTICSIAASSERTDASYEPIMRAIGASQTALLLALRAWLHAKLAYPGRIMSHLSDAEAAALIADGWTPEGWS